MKAAVFEDIHHTWFLADAHLTTIDPDLLPPALTPHYARAINDCSYFVLLFGQLEESINRAYEELIGPWENAAFEHRVNLLRGIVSDYEADTIIDDYEIRCEIAHGRLIGSLPIQVSVVAQRYLRIAESWES